MRDELYHYGVKGQKWGRRQYQNPDGTWTDKGKARRRIGGNNINETTQYLSDTGRRAMESYNMLKPKHEKGENIEYAKYKDEMDKMSDDELRKRVNRLNTENQYVKLNSERNMSKGKQRALSILKGAAIGVSLAANVATIVSGGANIATLLLKGGIGSYKTNEDGTIAPNGKVSKVTRNVINDYNTMSDRDFLNKYKASRKTYLKRLSKHDDPYMYAKNSGWYKAAKKIANANTAFNRARKRALQNPKTRARLENWEEPYEKKKKSIKHSDELYHYGVKGQKWGIRRYQNEDGSYKNPNSKRYADKLGRGRVGRYSTRGKLDWDDPYGDGSYERFNTKAERDRYVSRTNRAMKIKKALKVGVGLAGAAALGYGAYKGMAGNRMRSQANRHLNNVHRVLREEARRQNEIARAADNAFLSLNRRSVARIADTGDRDAQSWMLRSYRKKHPTSSMSNAYNQVGNEIRRERIRQSKNRR